MALLQDLKSLVSKSRDSFSRFSTKLVNTKNNLSVEGYKASRFSPQTLGFREKFISFGEEVEKFGKKLGRDIGAGAEREAEIKANLFGFVPGVKEKASAQADLTAKASSLLSEGFISGPGTSIQSLGEKGPKRFVADVFKLPDIFKERGFEGGVASQEFEDATNLLDILPFGAFAGLAADIGKSSDEVADLMKLMGKGDAVKSIKPGAKQKVGKYIENINTERLVFKKGGKEALDKAVKDVKKIKPELEHSLGRAIKDEEIIEHAKRSEILKSSLSREDIIKRNASELRTRQQLTALSNDLAALKEGGGDAVAIAKKTEELIESFKVNQSLSKSAGVTLAARRIGAEAATEQVKIVNKMIKELDASDKLIEEIVEASKTVDFNNLDELADFYRKFVEPKSVDIINEFRYTNLLSNPKTHMNNAFTNLLQAVVTPADRLASGAIDFVRVGFSSDKVRRAYVAEVPEYIKGAINAIPEATKDAIKTVRGKAGSIKRPDIGFVPTQRLPGPLSKVTKAVGVDEKKVAKAFTLPLRALEAGDVFFRKIIAEGEFESLVLRELKKGTELTDEAMGLIRKQADDVAAEAIFRGKIGREGQGALFKVLDDSVIKIKEFGDKHPFFRWFVPFIDTPTNILKQGIERTPGFGLATLKGASKAEQSKILGRQLVGSLVFAGAGTLALQGKTTWKAPQGKNQRAAFFAEGKQEYAIKIGDKWIGYERIGPLAYPIALAAGIRSVWEEDQARIAKGEEPRGNIENLGRSMLEMTQFFGDQSYLENVGNFIDLISEGDFNKAERIIANMPAQLIPWNAALGFLTRIIDDVYRKPETILQNLQRGLPFVSKGVPPFETPTGDPATRQFNIFNQVSPVQVTEEKEPAGRRVVPGTKPIPRF